MIASVTIDIVKSEKHVKEVFSIAQSAALKSFAELPDTKDEIAYHRNFPTRGALVSAYSLDHYRQLLHNPNTTMLLARTPQGEAAGFVLAHGEQFIDQNDPSQELNFFTIKSLKMRHSNLHIAIVKQVAVANHSLRKGIGTLLYKATIQRYKDNDYDYLCAAIVMDEKLKGTRFDDGRGKLLDNQLSVRFHETLGFSPLVRDFVYQDEISSFYSNEYLRKYETGIHLRTMYTLPLRPDMKTHEVLPPIANRLDTYL